MQVLIISGSTTTESLTLSASKAVASLIQELAAENSWDITLNISDFINYNSQDFPDVGKGEVNIQAPFVQDLLAKATAAELIYFVSPEYNWMPSTALQNYIHRLANKDNLQLWQHKTFAYVGVSDGRGGRLPQIYLSTMIDKIISINNLHSISSPFFWEAQYSKKQLSQTGEIADQEYRGIVKEITRHNLLMAQIWQKGLQAQQQPS